MIIEQDCPLYNFIIYIYLHTITSRWITYRVGLTTITYTYKIDKKNGGILEELGHVTQKMVVIRIMASNTRESCDQ